MAIRGRPDAVLVRLSGTLRNECEPCERKLRPRGLQRLPPWSRGMKLVISRTNFRILVAGSLALYLAWFLLPLTRPDLDADLQAVLALDGMGAAIRPNAFLATWGLLALRVVALLGLLALWTPARWLLSLDVAVQLVLQALSGVSVEASLDSALLYAMSLADGAILVVCFSSPMARSEQDRPMLER